MTQKKNLVEVLQSPFEQAFVKVYLYLVEKDRWKVFKKFRHKKELLQQLGLPQNNISHYINRTRNIPEHHNQKIIDVLVNEYGVSHKFLTTNTGRMFLEDPILVNETASAYSTLTEKEFIKLQKELTSVKDENDRLKELVETQRALIKQLHKGK
ncbi:hypothetical protein [Limnovirga soli]|uniref:Uncharacterized protein n=1 Tax=Limnovirga soli TaxID=2656915 RepID=A0A8J8FFV3_9BACT|nr:hypothetical protein [Limnovirga soli]NNV55882.1 hypothetical protein [Limnovirga soli]